MFYELRQAAFFKCQGHCMYTYFPVLKFACLIRNHDTYLDKKNVFFS